MKTAMRKWILVGLFIAGVVALGQMVMLDVATVEKGTGPTVKREVASIVPSSSIETSIPQQQPLVDKNVLKLTPTCEPYDSYSSRGPSGREPTPCYYIDLTAHNQVYSPEARPCSQSTLTKPPGRHTDIKSQIESLAKQAPLQPCTACSDLLQSICEWDIKGSEWDSGLPLLVTPSRNIIRDTFECIPQKVSMVGTYEPEKQKQPNFDGYDHQIVKGVKISWDDIGKTEYYRKKPHGLIFLRNIAVGCAGDREPWMDHRRDCYLSVHSVHAENSGLAATHRKGRHAIYRQRQAAFQYGGTITNSKLQPSHVAGTSIFLSSFSQANIGHALHDALFSYLSVLSSFKELKGVHSLPSPHRIVIEPDFFRNSIRYYSVLAMVFGTYVMGTAPQVLVFNKAMVDVGGAVTQQQPSPDGSMFTFESAIFTGEDRELKGSGVATGARYPVVHHFREAVFDVLGSRPPNNKITIYIYGRTDVYRRSIINMGNLVDRIVNKYGAERVIQIPSMSLHPLQQASLFRKIDILLTVQGAHLQNSIFMPADGSVVEFSPCRARQTSFLKRYHTFLASQRHVQIEVCFPSINLGKDKYGQNLTLCNHHIDIAEQKVAEEVSRIEKERK
eukprot:TRINITY_DN11797_c0_g1_i2.p1 TRINITY_DN11797_c0_g1~~TRINITY_DN11797_c0_g1_i2.p1  ORF type:complete len:615 (+),score=66.92 TRINITY_DN11797_c0_g1_i2:68-1912(+)